MRSCRWLVLLALLGCRKQASKVADAAAPAAGADAAATIAVATIAATPDDGRGALVCSPYDERMATGRKAVAERRFDDALAAFDGALYTMPFDPPARAERGYVKILSGDARGAIRDLRFALNVAAPSLRSAILYNLGLAYERVADAPETAPDPPRTRAASLERARAYLAASAQEGSRAALDRLGTRSRCPAARLTDGLAPIEIAHGWKGLATAFAGTSMIAAPDAPIATEADAKRQICAPYDEKTSERDRTKDACGAAVVGHEIVVGTGYQLYHGFATHILPLDGGRFVAEASLSDGGACRGGADVDLSLEHGTIALSTTTTTEVLFTLDGARDASPRLTWDDLVPGRACPKLPADAKNGDYTCTVGRMSRVQYFDAASGKGLLTVEHVVPQGADDACADDAGSR